LGSQNSTEPSDQWVLVSDNLLRAVAAELHLLNRVTAAEGGW
jgi:hypothetical protein